MPSCGAGADGGGGRRTDHAVAAMITVTAAATLALICRCAGPGRCRSGCAGRPGPLGLLLAEAAEEAAEQAALAAQGGRRRRCPRALGGDRLVVVGPGDGVDGLRLVEVLGARDEGHEPDQVPVLHDLSLEPGGAVG